VTVAITRNGTAESSWRGWLSAREWPALEFPVAGQRVVAVAAHPDDEVLGAGGLLSRLARRHPIVMVWATDGEASHPGSTVVSRTELASTRREESRRALSRLQIAPIAAHHLGLPDGGLLDREEDFRCHLDDIVGSDDVVIAPWSGDGHPDHETVGRVASSVANTCWQYPIWAWHWAAPEDPRIPWDRLRIVRSIDRERKSAAISMFVSQVEALGDAPEDAAILPPPVLAHFSRSFEFIVV
jgi:LmbE family N-acetylglucosaminyl deacetylase